MGCHISKNSLYHVDDSVHVMLTHDQKMAKKKGIILPPQGYVPRTEHPLLRPKIITATEDDDEDDPTEILGKDASSCGKLDVQEMNL